MFDDPKRDLKRLEQELLAQEDEDWLDQELAEARRLLDDEDILEEDDDLVFDGQTYPGRSGGSVGNTDRLDVDLESYSDELLEEPPVRREKGVRALLVLIILELLGIAAVGVYWLVQLL